MVDGMEERDYYQGKVTSATDEQRRWVEQHAALADERASETTEEVR